MPFYTPSDYFDLSDFAHAALFEEISFVWMALEKIDAYLQKWPHFGKHLGKISPGAYLLHAESIYIGKGSVVEPGAYIAGPCIIGENCQIRHGAYLRGSVIVGDKCVVGHATEVKQSIFLNASQAGHFAYIGNSILGNQVNLGAGTKCANLPFEPQPVQVKGAGKPIETGLRKLGAIIGDHVQTGCNCVLNPGTLIGKQSCVAPLACVGGVVAERQFVKAAKSSIHPKR